MSNKMIKYTNNFWKRLKEKVKEFFRKESISPQNAIKLESNEAEIKNKYESKNEYENKCENKLNIPLKIDGTKDFSVISELIKNYENHKIKESELSREEINVLEEYYIERNIRLAEQIKYHLSKIQRMKQKLKKGIKQ